MAGVSRKDSFCRHLTICHADAFSREHSPHVTVHTNNAEAVHSSIKGYCKRFFHTWGRDLTSCQARGRFITSIFFKTPVQKRFQKLMVIMKGHSSDTTMPSFHHHGISTQLRNDDESEDSEDSSDDSDPRGSNDTLRPGFE